MAIYLHETPDVISGQMADYYDGLEKEAIPYLDEAKLKLVLFGQVNYSSGRWPEAVVVWEIDDWATYTAQMKAWKLPDAPADRGNTRYMTLAPKWRSGGFDRILIPVDWSPTPPSRPGPFKSSGAVLFHQTIRVAPGHAGAFVSSMERTVLPRLGDVGLSLEAFWRNVFDPLEYIGIFSAAGWDGYEQVQKSRRADDEGSQLPGLTEVWKHMTDLKEKVILSNAYSPLGGGVPTLGSAL